jgi:hypothetical protein
LSLVSRLRTASSLPADEIALALRAMIGLVRARAELALAGFDRIRRGLEPVPDSGTDLVRARAVRRAVERAARTVPGSTCLPRAIVAARMLRDAGVRAEIVIGVDRAAGSRVVDAHAWVRMGDFIVTGDDEAARFTALSATPARS